MPSPPKMRLINPTSRPSSPEPYLIGPSQSKCEQPNDESPEARSETNKHELNQIIKQIRAFISGDPESDKLWLRISGGLRDSEELDRALERLRVRSSFQGSTLVVYAGRPVHESLAESVQDWAFLRLIPEVLTPEESKCVSVTGRSMILHGKISGRSRKRQTQEKFPDKAIVMEDPTTGDQFCTVIFEVAFSEAYADLVRDMKQWLLCSDGQVQLVILANIEEDERTLAQRKETDDFKDRAAKFVNDFGTAFGKIIHASLLERLSDPSSQQEGQATEGTKQDSQTMDQPSFGAKVRKANREVKDEDWVGPITVDLEFWELKDSEPRKRGESVRIANGQATGNLPPIYVGDVIPPSCRHTFSNFDASRESVLNLDDIMEKLRKGIHNHAIVRAFQFARPKDEDEDDEDYEDYEE